jgi:hypothetical protein
LKVVRPRVRRTTFLNDDGFDVSTEALGFPKKMDGEKRTGRSTADDGNEIAVLEAT